MTAAARRGVVPIVALDFGTESAALALVERLGGRCSFYKVGSELFTAAGPRVVERLRGAGHEVFLDLKLHDIPNTVAGAVRSAALAGATLVTVHASGGGAMVRAAVEAAAESGARIVCVTVLTSLDAAALAAAWGRPALDVPAEVERLAGVAAGCDVYGVVCSGLEVAALRARFGDQLAYVVPGVRLAGDAAGDQARVVTPAAAAQAGASYVVLGRTVTAAADPGAAMDRAVASLSQDDYFSRLTQNRSSS